MISCDGNVAFLPSHDGLQMTALEQDLQQKLAELSMLEQQNQQLRAKAQALEMAVASSDTAWTLAQLPWMQQHVPASLPQQCQHKQQQPQAQAPLQQQQSSANTVGTTVAGGSQPVQHPACQQVHDASRAGSTCTSSAPASSCTPSSEPDLLVGPDSSIEDLRQSYKRFINRLSELLLEHDAASEPGEVCLGCWSCMQARAHMAMAL